MEDGVWIDFESGEEPEEHRPLLDGRYEGVVRKRKHKDEEPPRGYEPQRIRKEGGVWYWDWNQEDRLPVSTPGPGSSEHPEEEVILRVRRMGELYLSPRRGGGRPPP